MRELSYNHIHTLSNRRLYNEPCQISLKDFPSPASFTTSGLPEAAQPEHEGSQPPLCDYPKPTASVYAGSIL